jgi:Fic family protein
VRRGPTGRHEITTRGGEPVRAFVPLPLPPQPPLDLSAEVLMRLEAANLAIGRLDGVSALLPDTHLFLYTYVRKEALLSSQIEGTQSSLSELLLFELDQAPGAPVDDVIEVSNYVAALEHGLARLSADFPLSNRLIREIHGKLLQRGRGSDKDPGEFRRTQNWIGGTRPGNAKFVPPPPTELQQCMGALETFLLAKNDGLPLLVRAALAHVQFETIHPFLDGNGRVGRLLITLLLCHAKTLRQPLLYLSLFFKQHRDEYYRLLDLVRSDGDWEAWLVFFLDGVAKTADSAVATATSLIHLFADDRSRIEGLGRKANTALRVHDALKRRPVHTLQDVAKVTGLSFPAAASGMALLEQLTIAREITGKQRNRVFAYTAYLDALKEGTENL